MAKARALAKRRKSIRNIRKITRTMELIARARFKKALDRAQAATAYTERVTALVRDLAQSGLPVSHPVLEPRSHVHNVRLLVLTSNRGLCGSYNSHVVRLSQLRYSEYVDTYDDVKVEISGKRGLNWARFRGIQPHQSYTHFEDKPTFDEVEQLANRYLAEYIESDLDRLDVAYTRFESMGRQTAVVETLLPLGDIGGTGQDKSVSANGTASGPGAVLGDSGASGNGAASSNGYRSQYEFLPSAESILEEVVPTSFKVKLFKCFLDAAVSEQIARMLAMKGATDAAGGMIKDITLQYNRARQSQITNEIIEIIGGAAALE